MDFALRSTLEVVFPHLLHQGCTADAEAVGGSGYYAAAVVEGLLDEVALEVGDVFAQVDALLRQQWGVVHADVAGVAVDSRGLDAGDELFVGDIQVPVFGWQVLDADDAVGMHDGHALDEVGQLSHVARPFVVTQRHDGGGVEANGAALDRKSTRLNSSHVKISYAVFCLKKKKQ